MHMQDLAGFCYQQYLSAKYTSGAAGFQQGLLGLAGGSREARLQQWQISAFCEGACNKHMRAWMQKYAYVCRYMIHVFL